MEKKLERLVEASKWWWVVLGSVAFVATKSVLDWTIVKMGGVEPPDLWMLKSHAFYGPAQVAAFEAFVQSNGWSKFYTIGRFTDMLFPLAYAGTLLSVMLQVAKHTEWRRPLVLLALPILAAPLDYAENLSLWFGDGSIAGGIVGAAKFVVLPVAVAATASLVVAAFGVAAYKWLDFFRRWGSFSPPRRPKKRRG